MFTKEKDGSIKVQIEMTIKPKQEKKINNISTQLSSTSTETDLPSKPSTSVDPEPLQERQESQEADIKVEDSQREESEPEIKLPGETHTPGYSSKDSHVKVHTPGYSSKDSQVKVHTPGCSSKDSHVKVREESDIDIEQQSSHSEHSTMETPVGPEPLQEWQESQEADTNDEDNQREESEPEIKLPGEAHTPGCSSKDSQVKVQEESDIDIKQQQSHSEHSLESTWVDVTEQELKSLRAESGDADSCEQDKDASKKGFFSRLKSGAAYIKKGVTNIISWNTKEPRMKPIVIKREKPIVIKREKCVKLTKQSEEGQVPTEYIAVLMSAIPFKDIKDCSLSIKLSGKNCKNEDVGLFVRYS